METTQIILLRFLIVTGIFLAIAALYGSLLDAGLLFSKREKHFVLGVFFYLFLIVLGAIISAAAAFLLMLVGGNIT